MTKTFMLKGHCTNNNTILVVIEGKVVLDEQMPQEKLLGKDLANTLYNTLPSGTIDAMMAELKELHENWSE
jgi:hypothetical protein